MSLTRPNDGLQVDIVADGRAPDTVSPFRLIDLFWRRKVLMFSVIIVLMAGAAVQIASLIPRYETRALILIDTRRNAMSDLQAIVTGSQADLLQVQTQVDILRSQALALDVTRRLDLVREPEFAAALVPRPSGLAAQFAPLLALVGQAPPEPEPLSANEKLRAAALLLATEKMTVVNDSRSYVVAVQVRAEDPELAARIANTYAEVYLAFNKQLKDSAVQRANHFLDQRLAPLKDKLREAEREVAAYREQTGLIEDRVATGGAERRVTMLGQQLAQINGQLVQATAARLQREVSLDQIRQAQRGVGSVYNIPEVVASPLIQRLRTQQSEIAARQASLSQSRLESNPAVLALRAEEREVRARIDDEVAKTIGALASEVAAARAREEALRGSLAQLQGQVADQSKAEIRLRELESEATAARMVYTETLNRSEQNANQRDGQQPDASMISPANVPLAASPPTKRQLLVLSFLASCLIAVIAALVRDRLETGFRTAEQVEEETGLSALGFIPRARRRNAALMPDDAETSFVEAVNTVRGALQMADVAGRPKVVLITSALPEEGKTFFSVALARSVARAGGRSLLVDCDLRRPSIAATLGIAAQPGLGALVAGQRAADLVQRDEASGIDVITAVALRDNVQSIVSSEALRALLADAREQYDIIVLDSPPVLAVVDSRVMSLMADATVMVVRWRRTPRVLVLQALKQLRVYGARVAGVVITQANLRSLAASEGSHAYVYRKYGSYLR
jgi:capsular exopolysaccharide synthesis family protein